MANQRGLIVHKSKHKQIGKKHDYKIYKTNHPDMPKDVENTFDLGFLGVQKRLSRTKVITTDKKGKRLQVD